MLKVMSKDKSTKTLFLAFMVLLFLLKEFVELDWVDLDWVDLDCVIQITLQHGLGGPMLALGWLVCPVMSIFCLVFPALQLHCFLAPIFLQYYKIPQLLLLVCAILQHYRIQA
jgi:hypothetical protein